MNMSVSIVENNKIILYILWSYDCIDASFLLFVAFYLYAIADEADAYMFQFYRCLFLFSVFFLFFSIRHKNTRQPFSGTAERIFMKLLPNDSGENVVSSVVPKWGLGPQLIFGG